MSDEIIAAWTNAGSHPEFHRRWQNRLRKEWPTLARALDNAVRERTKDTRHDPRCPNYNGSCCPWMGDCTCQCMCDWIAEIRSDYRKKK